MIHYVVHQPSTPSSTGTVRTKIRHIDKSEDWVSSSLVTSNGVSSDTNLPRGDTPSPSVFVYPSLYPDLRPLLCTTFVTSKEGDLSSKSYTEDSLETLQFIQSLNWRFRSLLVLSQWRMKGRRRESGFFDSGNQAGSNSPDLGRCSRKLNVTPWNCWRWYYQNVSSSDTKLLCLRHFSVLWSFLLTRWFHTLTMRHPLFSCFKDLSLCWCDVHFCFDHCFNSSITSPFLNVSYSIIVWIIKVHFFYFRTWL